MSKRYLLGTLFLNQNYNEFDRGRGRGKEGDIKQVEFKHFGLHDYRLCSLECIFFDYVIVSAYQWGMGFIEFSGCIKGLVYGGISSRVKQDKGIVGGYRGENRVVFGLIKMD